MRNSIKIEDEVVAFLREKLTERLAKITDKQREFFGKVFPGAVRENDLLHAIDLCDRTIRKNEAVEL